MNFLWQIFVSLWKKIWNCFIFLKSQICCLPQSLIPGSWTLLCRFTVGVIGLELQERKDRGLKASKRQSWLSKRWNAFIRACPVASNVPTSSLPFLSALQCPSAEKISFSRLSRFAALAAISLRSPTSISLSFFLSSPLAAAALVLSTSSSSTAKTTVSPLKRRSIWRSPQKKKKKRNSSSFFHVSREIFLIFYCRQFQSVVRFGKNFVKIWLLLKWLASERCLWTL